MATSKWVEGTARWSRTLLAAALVIAFIASIGLAPGRAVAQDAGTPVAATASGSDAPIPVTFPIDDGEHLVPVEWWYYTGHLFTESGERYGFEFVVFRAEQGGLSGYASHFAITDNPDGTFSYDQRFRINAPGYAPVPGPTFDLAVSEWTMRGSGGEDHLQATMDGYAIDLTTTPLKPPALHDGDGYIDYGNEEASYYYSRTRLEVAGTLTDGADELPVTGEAWFDHQWGAFNTFVDGGWDWYSLQLSDGSDLMLYIIHDGSGAPLIVDGSVIDPDGNLAVLDGSDFTVTATGSWTSTVTGITWPSGWTISLPEEGLDLVVTPSQPDSELDTRASTQVIYWEGEVEVSGSRDGAPVTGLGYVELTGYEPPE